MVNEADKEVKDEAVEATHENQLIFGEVHIISDPKTGVLSAIGPKNIVACLGLLEIGKVLLLKQHDSAMNRPPAIISPRAADIIGLRKPS